MREPEEKNDKASNRTGYSRFTTTHWTVVLAAGQPGTSRYQQALETLCRTYWFPLYAYLRRCGYDTHNAEEHTQAFFASLIEKGGLRLADPNRGKFRSFLLTAIKHFLADERDRIRAIKRGGSRKIISLDVGDAETRYALEPATHSSPERLFEKSWALTVLNQAMAQLKAESVNANKQELFDRLKGYLTGEKGFDPYRDAAADLNMTEGAVKVTVHRLRATEDQIADEIRDLFAALAY
jgi:RNA polymerase sigma-70 factor (ECF subfamily)